MDLDDFDFEMIDECLCHLNAMAWGVVNTAVLSIHEERAPVFNYWGKMPDWDLGEVPRRPKSMRRGSGLNHPWTGKKMAPLPYDIIAQAHQRDHAAMLREQFPEPEPAEPVEFHGNIVPNFAMRADEQDNRAGDKPPP